MKHPNRQGEESRYLAEIGMALLKCDQANLVFERLGAFLYQVTSDVIIILNQATPDQQSLITRQVIGLEGALWAQAEKLVGFKIVGKVSPIVPKFRDYFFQTRLQKIPGGFSELAASEIPKKVGRAAEKLLGFQDVFTIGIADQETIWGNVHIITRRPTGPGPVGDLPVHLIEAVVYQCFSVLSRIHAVQELAASEKKYRLLFQNLSAGFALHEIILDEDQQPCDYRFLEVNPAFEQLTGLQAGDLIGRTVREALPDIEPYWIETYGRVATTGAPAHFERYNQALARWYQVVAYAPEPGHFATVFQDITARKQAEEALREKSEELDKFFSSAIDLLCIADTDGYFRRLNVEWEKTLGYTLDELEGRRFLDLVHPDDLATTLEAVATLSEGHEILNFTNRYRCQDGAYLWIEWRSFPSGKLIYAAARDITARKQAEETLLKYRDHLEELVQTRTAELQAQYAQLDAILRSVGDAICMTDPEQRIRYVNPAFTTLTGYPEDEVLGQEVGALEVLADFVPRLPSIIPTLMQGKPWQGDVRARRKDGRRYDAALTIAPVHNDGGQVTGYVFTHRDVSQAKDLARARAQFITNVSHQFRTPLTLLKTSIYLLLHADPTEKQRRQLQAMEASINWLIQLVQDTLEISDLDSGKGAVVWEPVSLSDIVRMVLERYQSQAQATGLTLVAAPVPPDLPFVTGDAGRLAQALGELVENALVFTPAGGQVNVALQASVAQGENWIKVAVQDTGPGIAPEEQPQLFERFFRGRLAASGHTAGVGLGLSIAQKIAQAHGGRITVESAVGQGSTFTLWLRSVLREGGSL